MGQGIAVRGVLLCIGVFFCLMSLFSLLLGLLQLSGLFDGCVSGSYSVYFAVQAGSSLLAGVAWAITAQFIHLVRSNNEVFSKRQSRKLYFVGALFAVRFATGLLLPTIDVNGPSQAVEGALGSAPTVDLFVLSLSVLFFALGAVFEYGRILQEDADDIL